MGLHVGLDSQTSEKSNTRKKRPATIGNESRKKNRKDFIHFVEDTHYEFRNSMRTLRLLQQICLIILFVDKRYVAPYIYHHQTYAKEVCHRLTSELGCHCLC